MAFELFTPLRVASRVSPASCTIDKNGMLTISEGDAAALRIKSAAVVLLDKSNGRIAIRAPRESEIAVRAIHLKSGSAKMNIRSALRALGRKLETLRGTHGFLLKDGIGVVQFV